MKALHERTEQRIRPVRVALWNIEKQARVNTWKEITGDVVNMYFNGLRKKQKADRRR